MTHLPPDWIINPELCAQLCRLCDQISGVEIHINPWNCTWSLDILFECGINEYCARHF
jgi:hypothetical protein